MDNKQRISKEKLEYYAKTNRIHFIRLANAYERSEPEYYKEVVKPILNILDAPPINEKKDIQFCPQCGTANKDNFRFCSNCGTALHNHNNPSLDFASREIKNQSELVNNQQSSGAAWFIPGFIFALISLFIFPPLFGITAIVFGFKTSKINKGLGIFLIIFSVIAMAIGMYIGMVVMQNKFVEESNNIELQQSMKKLFGY